MDSPGNLDDFFDFQRLEADGQAALKRFQKFPEALLDHDLDVHPALDEMDEMEWQCDVVAPHCYPAIHPVPPTFNEEIEMDTQWDGTTSLAELHLGMDIPELPVDASFSPVQHVLSPLEDKKAMPYVDSFVLASSSPSPPSYNIYEVQHTTPQVPSAADNPRGHLVRQSSGSQRTPASAKRKGLNTRIPLEARQMLEEEFATNPYPCGWEIDIIAHQANIDAKRVRNWFNNARARKKAPATEEATVDMPTDSTRSLTTKLSVESLETLAKEVERGVLVPQPPLAVYLASSYREEAADLAAIQAAIKSTPSSSRADTFPDSSSGSRVGRSGSVITSVTSTDSSAPTTFTTSSHGSNISSFGRDRRRGRRRMTWKNSPYSRAKVNGVDDSGTPTQGLPFFCTFCPRAFKTKYEWIRHEDSVHALRTTWICCNVNTRDEPFLHCPFCGHKHPDDAHLTSHKYQQCRNKPETQRTFYRRDHFVQHLHHVHFANVRHPAAKLGCQNKLTTSSGDDYGCKDLAMKWRRFGAPMRADDPMLHCGFCGLRSEDWDSRCNHVAEHLISGGFDRSAWWSDRLATHLENLCTSQTTAPFRCRYCRKIFVDERTRDSHTHCRVWSCRFLRTCDDVTSENAAPPLCPQFPSPRAHHCHLCGAGYRNSHTEHAVQYHAYRQCSQKLYSSEADFLTHLLEFHGASHQVLVGAHTQDRAVLEQQFSRNKGASFEPLEFFPVLPQEPHKASAEISFASTLVDPSPSPDSFAYHEPHISTHNHPLPSPSISPPPSLATSPSNLTLAPPHPIQPHSHQSPPPKQQDGCDLTTLPPPRRQRFLHKESIPAALPNTTPPSNSVSGPRFFRLSPRIFFLRPSPNTPQPQTPLNNPKPTLMHDIAALDPEAVLEEITKPYLSTLVLSSGLLGLAGARVPVDMKFWGSGDRERERVKGVGGIVEFGIAGS